MATYFKAEATKSTKDAIKATKVNKCLLNHQKKNPNVRFVSRALDYKYNLRQNRKKEDLFACQELGHLLPQLQVSLCVKQFLSQLQFTMAAMVKGKNMELKIQKEN